MKERLRQALGNLAAEVGIEPLLDRFGGQNPDAINACITAVEGRPLDADLLKRAGFARKGEVKSKWERLMKRVAKEEHHLP